MTIEKMREEFELAFSAKTASMLTNQDGYLPEEFAEIHLEVMIQDRDGDTYRTDIYRSAWWAWQASIYQIKPEVEALRKDAARLDRLDMECEAYGTDVHEGNRWVVDGPFATVRDAIDAAIIGEAKS